MNNAVLDSFAVLAFLRNEAGGDTVKEYFDLALAGKKHLFICSVNWAEVGYIVIRKKGLESWRKTQAILMDFPFRLWRRTLP